MKQDYENKLKNIEASMKEADEKDRVISGLIKELTPDYEAKCDVHEAMEKDYDQTKLKFFGIINNLNSNFNTFKSFDYILKGTKTQKTKLENNIQTLKDETVEHEVLRV